MRLMSAAIKRCQELQVIYICDYPEVLVTVMDSAICLRNVLTGPGPQDHVTSSQDNSGLRHLTKGQFLELQGKCVLNSL